MQIFFHQRRTAFGGTYLEQCPKWDGMPFVFVFIVTRPELTQILVFI